jgi:hypothetical protein
MVSTIQYRRKLRELNFQKRAQAYHATEDFLKKLPTMNAGRGIRAYNFTYPTKGHVYTLPNGFHQVLPSVSYPASGATLFRKNELNRTLAAYKQKLNANIDPYIQAGYLMPTARQAAKYAKYGTALRPHPGMKIHLAEMLNTIRARRNPVNYGRMWMEKSGVMSRRAETAKAKANAETRTKALANYQKILRNDTSRLNMAKIRRYTKNWLGINLNNNANWKAASRFVHPNKGKQTHVNNQAKRNALLKLVMAYRNSIK